MITGRYPWGIPSDLLKELHKKKGIYVLTKLLLLFFIWGLLGYWVVRVESTLLKIMLWLTAGYFINGLVQLIHESWHHNLFQKRWQNHAAGHFLSFLFFTLYHPPRHGHMLHHRYNRSEKDPDAYNAGKKSWDLVLIYYGVFLVGVPLAVIHFNLLYPLQFYKRSQLPKHFIQLGILIGMQVIIWSILIKAGLFSIAWQVWLMPLLFTSLWNGMKSVADHFENDWQGSPLRTAATVTSTRFTTYFWNGLNYHLEHHLFPGVPGYNLPKLHSHLKELFKNNNSPVFSNYSQVWFHALLRGPELIHREGKFNPFNFQIEKNL